MDSQGLNNEDPKNQSELGSRATYGNCQKVNLTPHRSKGNDGMCRPPERPLGSGPQLHRGGHMGAFCKHITETTREGSKEHGAATQEANQN